MTMRPEVDRLFQEDQQDRQRWPAEWTQISARDLERRVMVRGMIDRGELESADELFAAAMILQHGDSPADYELARDLCRDAMTLDPAHTPARSLYACAVDRYLHSTGLPQIYGTQAHTVDGIWTMEPFDRAAVSDAERVTYGVDIAQTMQMIAERNSG